MTDLEKTLMKNVSKTLGKDNQMTQLTEDGEYGHVRGYIDTGVYALNWIISGKLTGGYPIGRITILQGDPSTGKSLLCEMAMKAPNIDVLIYFDTEAAMNIDFLKFLGVNPEKVLYVPIDTVEQIQAAAQEVLDTIEANNQKGSNVLFIIDSIALASTEKELDPDRGTDMGAKAKLIREFFRKYARKIEKHNIAMLITNHYTQKIGVTYGPTKVATGGTGLTYAASVMLELKQADIELDKKLESLGAAAVTIKAQTIKNRCFTPRRKASFLLDFEHGVNKYSGLFTILADLGIAKKSGAWCTLPQWDPEKKFFAKEFPDIIEKNDMLPLIQKLIDEQIEKGFDDESLDVENELVEQTLELEQELVQENKKRKVKKDV